MRHTTCSFNDGFNTNTKQLRAFAYHLTNDWHKAQDLYQDTALRAYKNKDKFQEGTNIKSWLLTIMRNTFINDYRKKQRQRMEIMPLSPNNEQKVHSFNNGEDNIAEQEILSVINTLNDGLKAPFMMSYTGYKYKEIAEKMYLPEGTIKSRIFMARKSLQQSVRRN